MNNHIIVTGFGSFPGITINSSWEAVKLLPDEFDEFTIIKKQLPVSYSGVDQMVPALWKEYNPEIVVHVGVKATSDKLSIETCAHKKGYTMEDIDGKLPQNGICSMKPAESYIQIALDPHDVCNHLCSRKSIQASVSEDTGRFLCEYTFFTSLSINRYKTLFVHVPEVGQPYSAEQMAEGLLEIIRCLLNQRKKLGKSVS